MHLFKGIMKLLYFSYVEIVVGHRIYYITGVIIYNRPLMYHLIFCRKSFDSPEVNSLVVAISDSNKNLYAGCGDNCVHIWDIESGSLRVGSIYYHGYQFRSYKTEKDFCARLHRPNCLFYI